MRDQLGLRAISGQRAAMVLQARLELRQLLLGQQGQTALLVPPAATAQRGQQGSMVALGRLVPRELRELVRQVPLVQLEFKELLARLAQLVQHQQLQARQVLQDWLVRLALRAPQDPPVRFTQLADLQIVFFMRISKLSPQTIP